MQFSLLNFSAKSTKKPLSYGLPFLITIYSPKNDNKHIPLN